MIEELLAMSEEEVESFIRETFELNYERLQLEGGHSLTPYTREAAKQQVLLYWKKMRDVALNITDTEVKLVLPGQTTPAGRNYTIEGIVDIVRENDRTVMYDIKTHEPDYVRANQELYEKQLNVYAHIWQELRGQELDQTAIIATAFSRDLGQALRNKDERRIEMELAKWEPLIDIPLDQRNVEETIRDFGAVVDQIEEKHFTPPSVAKLKETVAQTNQLFATRVCRNCDARFSCSSYRIYAMSTSNNRDFNFSEYFSDYGSDTERNDRVFVTLDEQPPRDSEE